MDLCSLKIQCEMTDTISVIPLLHKFEWQLWIGFLHVYVHVCVINVLSIKTYHLFLGYRTANQMFWDIGIWINKVHWVT